MLDVLIRWGVSAVGAAAITGGLFVTIQSLVGIGDPEPGRELIAWQDANPPEYGGAFDPDDLPGRMCDWPGPCRASPAPPRTQTAWCATPRFTSSRR